MKRETGSVLICAAVVVIGAGAGMPVAMAAPAAAGGYRVAGPGRVEPVSDIIRVGIEMSGRIESIAVKEGDKVKQKQVLATLANDEYKAGVDIAEAELKDKEAALLRLVNGSRKEEKAEALAIVKETEADMAFAKQEMDRQQGILNKGGLSRGEMERCEREYKTAAARNDAAKQRLALLEAGAREEDRARAEAEVQIAKARLAVAKAQYEKTFIRAPIDGVVLRKNHRVGEGVSAFGPAPDSMFLVGDLSKLRVRMDVDEVEAGKINVGQSAYVTAKAFGGTKFPAKVVQVGLQTGRRNVRTDEPAEYVDTKVFEAILELDDGHELVVGMIVDGFIDAVNAKRD